MIVLFALAILMYLLFELYVFFVIKRALAYILGDIGAKPLAFWSLGAVASVSLFAIWFFGYSIWLVFILHIMVFNLFMRLLNYLLARFKVWNGIYNMSLIPLILTACFFVYGYFNMSSIVKTSYTVSSDKLSKSFKIALLADIHHGTAGHIDDIRKMADDISREGADIAVLCGDIIDEKASLASAEEIFSELGKIKSEYGVYFVYGNHDCSAYLPNLNYSRGELESVIRGAGIEILDDKYKTITDEIILSGRLDKSMDRKTASELLKGADKDAFIIMADHQPTDFEAKESAGADLQISGHTHGGQIFPVGYINTLISPNEQCYGIEKYKDMVSVVSSGVYGWGFPIRTQGHSEWVMIEIR